MVGDRAYYLIEPADKEKDLQPRCDAAAFRKLHPRPFFVSFPAPVVARCRSSPDFLCIKSSNRNPPPPSSFVCNRFSFTLASILYIFSTHLIQ